MSSFSLDECDSDSANEMELGPEVYALFETIQEVTPLLREQVDAYGDLRRRVVCRNRQKPTLSTASSTIFEQECGPRRDRPSGDEASASRSRNSLAMIGQLLQQLAVERAGALRSSEETIRQLQSENAELNRMLGEYRQREFEELKGDDSKSDDTLSPNSSPRVSPRVLLKPARRSTRGSPAIRTPPSPTPLASSRSRSGSRVSFSPECQSNGSVLPHAMGLCA
jgi:hypothetical protein